MHYITKKSDTGEGERMITKTVIQSSSSEDVIKKASALLAHGRYYQDASNELSLGIQSLLWHYFIYNKNKNGEKGVGKAYFCLQSFHELNSIAV